MVVNLLVGDPINRRRCGEAGDERPDLEASEQDYTVDFLDGLVVRLIENEINAFKAEE